MKKYIYILFVALLAASCVEPLQPVPQPQPIDLTGDEDGPLVNIEFTLPPKTKAQMGHDPNIKSIHVAVFNKAGVLKQYEKATLINPENITNGDNPSGNPTYSVEVKMSSAERILHFIGDSPVDTYDELIALAGTSGEDAVMNALKTTGGQAAYWQRFVLSKIDAYRYQGGVYTYTEDGQTHSWGEEGGTSYTYTADNQTITVYQGDYIKRNGTKVLDGTGYFASDDVSGTLANIPFVRNFAEISVSAASASKFIPTKFALVNVPRAGYVAPFDTDQGKFATAYIGGGTLTHAGIAGTDYPGSLAAGTNDAGTEVELFNTACPTTFISTDSKAYMYERTVPNSEQPSTCILVGGTYTGVDNPPHDTDGNTWFMIELTDKTGSYFPIYRGVTYDFMIESISGTTGYASPEKAYLADPIGDISKSVTTATLDQISDGNGTTLWVEYIDYISTESTQSTKTLYYTMYYKNPSTGAVSYLNDGVTLSVIHPDASYAAIVGTPTEESGTFSIGTPDDTKTWKKATVTLAGSGLNTKRSVLHVEGNVYNSTRKMSRDVNYRVMGVQHFQNGENVLSATPLGSEDSGEETTLSIYLPSDLGYSMFPLTLRIEMENENYTTIDGLPVESGPSLFGTGKNAFYFLKTIEYSDYYNVTTGQVTTAFTTRFKTTRAGGTTSSGTNATRVAVLDKVKADRGDPYFETAYCNITVGGPEFTLSANEATVKASATSAMFEITSTGDEDPTWSLSVTGGATLSQNSGSGNATITVSFPENTSTTSAKTYTVTASREGFANQVFTITQQKKDTGSYSINLDAGAGSYNDYTWTSAGTVSLDGTSFRKYQSNNQGVSTSLATMSVTVTGYTEFTVYIQSYAEERYDYVVVRQVGADPLDEWTYNGTYYSYSNTKAHTRSDYNEGGSTLDSYRAVTFTTDDGLTADSTPHTFYIQFGKDEATDYGDDCGYVLIPEEYNLTTVRTTVEYTYADFGEAFDNYDNPGYGLTRTATNGIVDVSVSNIIGLGYDSRFGGYIEVQKSSNTLSGYSSESVVTISPVGTGTTIQDAKIEFLYYSTTNNSYWNPQSISGPFSGGTGTSLISSYSGSATTSEITATLTPYYSYGFDIVSISVTYTYSE